MNEQLREELRRNPNARIAYCGPTEAEAVKGIEREGLAAHGVRALGVGSATGGSKFDVVAVACEALTPRFMEWLPVLRTRLALDGRIIIVWNVPGFDR